MPVKIKPFSVQLFIEQYGGAHERNKELAIGAGRGHIVIQRFDPLAANPTRLIKFAGVVPSISARRASQSRSNYVSSHNPWYDRQVRKSHKLCRGGDWILLERMITLQAI